MFDQFLFDGRMFCAGDADENDLVTGQATFAATTPTFLLEVPSGTTAMPLWVILSQAGTVAGGVIECEISFDRVGRFSTGGTSETITHMHTGRPNSPACLLYSGATAAAATDARRIFSAFLDQDVTDPNTTESLYWSAKQMWAPLLVGPAAFLVFTVGATTGPTWAWSIGWLELPSASAD
jgi:hypothetical protein